MKTEKKMLGIGMTQANVPKVMSGAKTQTRRTVKFCKLNEDYGSPVVDECFVDLSYKEPQFGNVPCLKVPFDGGRGGRTVHRHFPDYGVGDRLYVKEALECKAWSPFTNVAAYKTDFKTVAGVDGVRLWESDDGKPWKNIVIPARYMPRTAARTFIEITDVRCERVQDISEADAHAEGIEIRENVSPDPNSPGSYVLPFIDLWNDTNSEDAWERNDWVFAYTFKLTEAPQ